MTPDPLDDLLDRSAPATRAADDADARRDDLARRGPPAVPRRRGASDDRDRAARSRWCWSGDDGRRCRDRRLHLGPVAAGSARRRTRSRCRAGSTATCASRDYTSAADPAFAADVNRIVEEWWRSDRCRRRGRTRSLPAMIDADAREPRTPCTSRRRARPMPGGYGTEWYDARPGVRVRVRASRSANSRSAVLARRTATRRERSRRSGSRGRLRHPVPRRERRGHDPVSRS